MPVLKQAMVLQPLIRIWSENSIIRLSTRREGFSLMQWLVIWPKGVNYITYSQNFVKPVTAKPDSFASCISIKISAYNLLL
jgi:hypothetical protein